MKVAKTIDSVKKLVAEARKNCKKIGFVPTMGALHRGHIWLIENALKNSDFVVVSIFVNPTQFGPEEDFEKYPRPLDDDLKICKENNVNVVFTPSVKEIYTEQNFTWVNVEKLTETLCGKSRPGHFRGVTTVCAKLFNIVEPDIAFFGQKDAQQALVIKKMVTDLNFPIKIVICPTIREPNGLAVSSRNKYLTNEQRKQATLIYKSLQNARKMIEQGTTNPQTITEQMCKTLSRHPAIKIEYISIVNTQNLQPIDHIGEKNLIAIAAKLGSARLIDNIIVDLTI